MDLDNLQTFHSLFSNWRFHIPDYQRGYAWGADQWQDLMDDLSTLTEDNDHFTGLLVLHENKDPNLLAKALGIVKEVHDIVDGQQRLTTVLILLNEISREMLAIGTDDLLAIAKGIQQTYLYEPGPRTCWFTSWSLIATTTIISSITSWAPRARILSAHRCNLTRTCWAPGISSRLSCVKNTGN